jgi:hypothetical protein
MARGQGFRRSARVDRQGGGRHHHPLGGRVLRFQDHEWKALTTYGAVEGASFSIGPSTAPKWRPGMKRPKTKLGVTRTGDRPGLPGNNNYKVFEKGASRWATKRSIPAAWPSVLQRL